MTQVIEIRPAPNCFDGAFMKEVELDTPIDEPLMRRVAHGAALSFHPEFPRPYFRIQLARAFTVQGVIGSTSLRATLSRSDTEGAMDLLRRRIEEERAWDRSS
jgi:hypothetical protein